MPGVLISLLVLFLLFCVFMAATFTETPAFSLSSISWAGLILQRQYTGSKTSVPIMMYPIAGLYFPQSSDTCRTQGQDGWGQNEGQCSPLVGPLGLLEAPGLKGDREPQLVIAYMGSTLSTPLRTEHTIDWGQGLLRPKGYISKNLIRDQKLVMHSVSTLEMGSSSF